MKILVTGAAGYIGSVLVERLLEENHTVIAIDNFRYKQPNIFNHLIFKYYNRFQFYNLNVITQFKEVSSLLNKCDVIVPLAALVGMGVCSKNRIEATMVNYESIKWQKDHLSKDQLIIYPNTNSGYGKTLNNEVCTEETPMVPISHYGMTKCIAEDIAIQHENSIVFRLATVFGASPRMRLDLLVNHLTFKAYKGEDIVLYEKEAMRNYVHVQDVANAFIFGINNRQNMKQQIYNLGHDESNMNKEDLVNTIREIIPWTNVSYDDKTKDQDQRDYIVSSKKLADAGFKAKFGVEKGIQELLCLYQSFAYNSDMTYMYNE